MDKNIQLLSKTLWVLDLLKQVLGSRDEADLTATESKLLELARKATRNGVENGVTTSDLKDFAEKAFLDYGIVIEYPGDIYKP